MKQLFSLIMAPPLLASTQIKGNLIRMQMFKSFLDLVMKKNLYVYIWQIPLEIHTLVETFEDLKEQIFLK